ncbi:MAG: PhzF family phenazine biosynthesis isomerase, partial [Dehalococcoidia bacterium]|nr:PhzF family phenazine biosynthesis isomerase [Dehalococcoidia bacterium]
MGRRIKPGLLVGPQPCRRGEGARILPLQPVCACFTACPNAELRRGRRYPRRFTLTRRTAVPEYRYLHYDVFTDALFEGNPLAVLPDARGLSTEQMQTIAQEMAFSETTFVLPRERDDTDIRMRIFTPAAELPMAG